MPKKSRARQYDPKSWRKKKKQEKKNDGDKKQQDVELKGILDEHSYCHASTSKTSVPAESTQGFVREHYSHENSGELNVRVSPLLDNQEVDQTKESEVDTVFQNTPEPVSEDIEIVTENFCEVALPVSVENEDYSALCEHDLSLSTKILRDLSIAMESKDGQDCALLDVTVSLPLDNQEVDQTIESNAAAVPQTTPEPVLEEIINENRSEGALPVTPTSVKNKDYLALFVDALPLLMKILPDLWIAMLSKDGLHIVKMSASIAKVSQRSIFVSNAGELKVFVHSHELKREHAIYEQMPALTFDDAAMLSNSVVSAVAQLRLLEICVGVPEEKYKALWRKSSDCFIDLNTEQEVRYTQTCRSNKCEWAVRQTKRRCNSCINLHKKFSERSLVAVDQRTKKVATPKKFKPLKCLSSPEKVAKMRRSRKILNNVRRKCNRLALKVKALISEEGVTLGAAQDGEMLEIVEEAFSNSKDGSLQKLFLEQQIAAAKRKSMRGMQWHPLIIRLALQIRMVSASAYKTLRESGFLQLPSETLLFDYSHIFETKSGVNHDILNDVAQEVAAMKKPYQNIHLLLGDEVHVSQNLVQKKSTGELVGYCNITEVQQEMAALAEKVTAAGEGSSTTQATAKPKSPPMATKIQSYMIRGVANNIRAVVASYPVSSLSSCDLYDYTWEVIEACESHNIKIVSKVCDGGASNRGFFDLNPPCTKTDSGVVYDTINLYAPERQLFFISDPPHLLKTARNCLYYSGRKQSRNMIINGEPVTWAPIVRLFNEKSEMTVKKLHKLTAACVYLNSYSMMNVKLAARVMSGSVANALEASNWPNTKELRVFNRL